MSLLRYFKRKDPAIEGIFVPVVPVANDGGTVSANVCVGDLASEPPSKWSKTHRHSYRYDPTTRAQIGEYIYNNGPAAAVRHFSMLLGYRIPESTTRKFQDAYITELKKQRNSDSSDPLRVQTLPTKPRGRPLMLGDLDDVVKENVVTDRQTDRMTNQVL